MSLPVPTLPSNLGGNKAVVITNDVSKNKEKKMGIKDLVGKKMTKNVKFMGEEVKISKLTLEEVMGIQEKSKEVKEEDSTGGMDVLKLVVRSSVEGADALSDEDFNDFPIDELTRLSTEIMKFSGLGEGQGK